MNSLSEVIDIAKYENVGEWIIISNAIMIDEILAYVDLKFKQKQLAYNYFNPNNVIILKWLLDYFEKFNKSPGPVDLQNIFDLNRKKLGEDTAIVIEEILDRYAEEFNDIAKIKPSIDHLKKKVIPDFAKLRAGEILKRNIELCIDTNRPEDIGKAIDNHPRFTIDDETDFGVSIPGSDQAVNEYFSSNMGTQLFQLDGDLGKLIGPFYRGASYAITGVEKRGKSYFAQNVGYFAVMFKRLKSLNISLELPTRMLNRRTWCRAGNYTSSKGSVGLNLIPVFDCINNQLGTCGVRRQKLNFKNLFRSIDNVVQYYDRPDWKVCTSCRNKHSSKEYYSLPENRRFIPAIWFVEKEIKLLNKFRIRKTNNMLKFFNFNNLRNRAYSTSSVNFDEIYDFIKNYSDKTRFYPDVIIIDYPDILQPVEGKYSDRHSIDYNWSNCRKLAQELNVVLLLPDQTKMESREGRSIKETGTSENKLKDAHIDLRITLNSNWQEYQLGIQRVGTLFKREGELSNQEVMLLQNNAVGNRMVDSCFWPHTWLKYPTVKTK